MEPFLFQVFRVYYDRLVDDKDRDWLFTYVREVCKEKLREDFDQLFIHLDFDNDGKVTEDDLRSLVYCDFADPKSDSKHYVEVRDLEQLRHVVEGYLEEFNNMSKKPMNLVLFRLVYMHTCVKILLIDETLKNQIHLFLGLFNQMIQRKSCAIIRRTKMLFTAL